MYYTPYAALDILTSSRHCCSAVCKPREDWHFLDHLGSWGKLLDLFGCYELGSAIARLLSFAGLEAIRRRHGSRLPSPQAEEKHITMP